MPQSGQLSPPVALAQPPANLTHLLSPVFEPQPHTLSPWLSVPHVLLSSAHFWPCLSPAFCMTSPLPGYPSLRLFLPLVFDRDWLSLFAANLHAVHPGKQTLFTKVLNRLHLPCLSAAIGSTFNPNYTDHKISFKRSLLHLSELISIIFLLPVPHMQSQMLYLHVQREDETTRHLDATQGIGFNLH